MARLIDSVVLKDEEGTGGLLLAPSRVQQMQRATAAPAPTAAEAAVGALAATGEAAGVVGGRESAGLSATITPAAELDAVGTADGKPAYVYAIFGFSDDNNVQQDNKRAVCYLSEEKTFV